MQKIRAESAPDDGLPATLSPFAGFDAGGRPVTLVTGQTKWILPVIIHPAQTSLDLDYVTKLRKAIPNRELAVVGLCDPNACGSSLGQSAPEFAMVAYGSYAPLQDIARFDDRGQLLLLNRDWRVKQALRRPASPEELAAELQQAIGQ